MIPMDFEQCSGCGDTMVTERSGCTQCGQSFSEKPPVRSESKPAPQPTEIGELKKDTMCTLLLTLCGMVLAFCGLFFFPLLIVGGFILLKVNQTAGGYRQVCCPNCKGFGKLQSKATVYSCPSCSEESSVVGSHLYPQKPKHIRERANAQFNAWLSADEEEN